MELIRTIDDGMALLKASPLRWVTATFLSPVFCLWGCGKEPDSSATSRTAIAKLAAGQWQGRSAKGKLDLALMVSQDGHYEWRVTLRGGRTPRIAHAGEWQGDEATPSPEPEMFALLLTCKDIYFNEGDLVKVGQYRLTCTKAAKENMYKLESPWGVFWIERVPEA